MARMGLERGDDLQMMTPNEVSNEARVRMLTAMTVLDDPLRRKGTKETVTLIDDGKIARTPVILTVVRPRTSSETNGFLKVRPQRNFCRLARRPLPEPCRLVILQEAKGNRHQAVIVIGNTKPRMALLPVRALFSHIRTERHRRLEASVLVLATRRALVRCPHPQSVPIVLNPKEWRTTVIIGNEQRQIVKRT